MASLTRDEIVAVLGPVDDILIADILRMGANAEELAMARGWVDCDEALANEGRPPPTGRVARLAEMLAPPPDENEFAPGPAGGASPAAESG